MVQVKAENEQESDPIANLGNEREEGELDDSDDESATIGLQSTMKSVIQSSLYPGVGVYTIEQDSQNQDTFVRQPERQIREQPVVADCSFVSTASLHSDTSESDIFSVKSEEPSTSRSIGI